MTKKRKVMKRKPKAKAKKRKVAGRVVVVTNKNLRRITRMKGVKLFRAFKASQGDGRSPTYSEGRPRLICKRGAILRVRDASTALWRKCAKGVNVATQAWVEISHQHYKHWLVEFKPSDIACIPHNSDGKFRLFRCKVVKMVKKNHHNY